MPPEPLAPALPASLAHGVEHLVGLLAQGWSVEDVLDSYPGLTREQLLACLKYAAESVANEQLFPVEA